MVHFHGTEYRSHTSCISEAQKYQGHLYKEKEKKGQGQQQQPPRKRQDAQAMVPRPMSAYVEDAPDLGDESNVIAVIDVPPRAPTPPPAAPPVEELPEDVNVFDFLVTEETPNGPKAASDAPYDTKMLERSQHYANGDSQYSQYSNGNGSQFSHHGFSYGNAPVNPTFERYDSWQSLDAAAHQPHHSMPPPPYTTPAPKGKHERKESKEKHKSEKSDKKRKRHDLEELDMSLVKRPTSRDETMLDMTSAGGSGVRTLHSGLTGGLSKLLTHRDDIFNDHGEVGASPLSPMKRSKRERERPEPHRKVSSGTTKTSATSRHERDERHRSREYHDDREDRRRHRHRRDSSSSADDRKRPSHRPVKQIEYRQSSTDPHGASQLVTYRSRAELFLSFVNKGPESDRGCSINKVLKRYHRERSVRGEDKEDEDKELWKSLRLRRNERGEIVVII